VRNRAAIDAQATQKSNLRGFEKKRNQHFDWLLRANVRVF
jgi:hypothetical protein